MKQKAKTPKLSEMTPARRTEEEDFRRRMAAQAKAERAAKEFRKAEKARVAKIEPKKLFAGRAARFKIARSFRAGYGRLS